VSGLASNPLGRFSPIWPQNRWRRFLAVWPENLLRQFSLIWPQSWWRLFSPVCPQNWWRRFLSFWPQNQGGGGFPGLSPQTGSSGLVISDLKSARLFLSLDLKIKWASVCRLRHKTDGRRSAWDTHRELAACFTWKQV
jgi:hypothetical protein